MPNNIVFSTLESNRFEKNVFRGSMDTVDVPYLESLYAANPIDLLIFRVPTAVQADLWQLKKLNRDVIVADTLVYYSKDLATAPEKPLVNTKFTIRTAHPDDAAQLAEIVPVIFKDYTNHYFSNPLLNREQISAGYTEWAVNYISGDGRICFVVEDEKRIIAFTTCSFDGHEGEIVLNGVLPEFQGMGVYSDIVRHISHTFKSQGIGVLKISTQIQNHRVQRVWINEGFKIYSSFLTIHLNTI